MSRVPTRARRLLRLSLLFLLALGIAAAPVLSQVGGIHEIEHSGLAVTDAAHGHAHPEPAQDPEHVRGSHALMHQAELGATAAIWPAWSLSLSPPPAATAPLPPPAAPRVGVPAIPFRPPIV